jgi:type VI secretion system protein ImpA
MGHPLDALLSPVSLESPCGIYLENSPELYTEFNALELSAKGKPEQVMGTSVKPAVEPNWGKVQELAKALLGKSKDLRVACYLTQSLIIKRGFAGLSDGLSYISLLLGEYWEEVHPQLIIVLKGEEDDDDPDFRINSIAYLGDMDFINSLSAIKLVTSRAVGSFSLKDYRLAIAAGDTKVENRPDITLINAAFMDVDIDVLQSARLGAIESMDSINLITKTYTEKLSAESSPQLEPLLAELRYVVKVYDEILSERGVASEGVAESPNEVEEGGQEMSQESAPAKQTANPGEVNSREDVIKQIEKICKYYQKNEPSSPVPLVLNRAKKLVTMDFMDIMKDMSPDSVHSIVALAGLEE